MKQLLMHIVDEFFMFSCLMAGVWLGMRKEKSKLPEEERKFKKWYHCCQYCKHMSVQGKPIDVMYCYCLHPDTKAFQSINKVSLDFFCGKWEPSDSFNTELFKAHSERCLESPNKGLKNFRQ